MEIGKYICLHIRRGSRDDVVEALAFRLDPAIDNVPHLGQTYLLYFLSTSLAL